MRNAYDKDNNIPYHSSTFSNKCQECGEWFSDGYLVWNKVRRRRCFVCEPCFNAEGGKEYGGGGK